MADEFELYDLKVEVVAGEKPFVCSHHVGDSFLVEGENLVFPQGASFSMYALAALLRRAAEIDVGERHHTGFNKAEDRLDPQRHRAEDRGKKKIQPHIRLGQLIDFLTHKASSPVHRRHKGGTNTDRYYIVAHGRARVQ